MYTVTVDKALAKGRKMVTNPASIIFCVTSVSPFIMSFWYELPAWAYGASFALGAILAWLYWSVFTTKWRVWAFSNVRNIHELQKRAISAQIIWPKGSFFEKTEIRSKSDKARLNELELRFLKPDIFIDDLSLPNETLIYFSKITNMLEMAVALFAACIGIFLIISNQYILGGVITIGGIWYSVKEYKQLVSSKPQIIISDRGLQTSSAKKFYNWNEIYSIDIEKQKSRNNTTYYLTYNCPEGAVEIKLDDLKINPTRLESMLYLYKARFKSQGKTSSYA